jgi:hypothetical protein
MYIKDPGYAPDALHYIRAFHLLQSDLQDLFEYIEPAHANATTYSYRCLELLIRACGEVEANCKVILAANGYTKTSGWLDIRDYRQLNPSHHLSSYRVRLPVWAGSTRERSPFAAWSHSSDKKRLVWYDAHHSSKHNRQQEFDKASLTHAVDAVCAVVVLLAAQFLTEDFAPVDFAVRQKNAHDGFRLAIGGYFEVSFPSDWKVEDRYAFRWGDVEREAERFQKLTFP